MKTKIAAVLTGFSALIMSSCSILDIDPKSEWSLGNMPTEQNHIEAILMGAYERLGAALQSGFVYYGDARADVYYTNSSTATSADRIVRSNLEITTSQANWSSLYQVVKQANMNIYYVPRMISDGTLDADKVNDMLGQAYCQRAIAYFWIVRIWGPAPLITKPLLSAKDNFDMPRSSTTDVLKLIHEDLEKAYGLLANPASSKYVKPITTFSLAAAHALSAQVYMWEKNYANALTELNYVVDKGGFSLEALYDPNVSVTDNTSARTAMAKTGFSRMFNAQKSSGSVESIFELSFSTSDGDTNNVFDSFWTATTTTFIVREDFVNTLKEFSNDRRYYASVKAASGGKYRCLKYVMDYVKGDARNIILMRLADILLLRAEARLNLAADVLTKDEADLIMKDINTIMVRAMGPDAEIPYDEDGEGYIGFSKHDIFNLLKSERRKELAFEGHRWFDLVRWGDAKEALANLQPATMATYVFDTGAINLKPNTEVWPIHINEIRRSKYIEQNEAYK